MSIEYGTTADFYIERTNEGVRAFSRHVSLIGQDTVTTFRHAVSTFGYLVENGERISLEAWRWRIAKHASPSERVISILHAIDRAGGAA